MDSSDNENVFLVKQKWSHELPDLKKSDIIGYWSLDGSRKVSFDASQLHYFSPERNKNQNVEFDLNNGIEMVKKRPEDTYDKIDHLLEWIKSNYTKIEANPETGRWIEPNFVCYRGLLMKVMKTPYEHRDGWIICAAKWRGTIYMCEFWPERMKIKKANETAKQKLMQSWGYKFEQFIVTDSPDEFPDTTKPVEESAEFCCVFQTRLNKNSVLFSAEMDGLCSDEKLQDPLPLEKLKFVELKTSKDPDNSHQMETLKRHKFFNWWSQCFLVGIENVLCGFRDDAGIIKYLRNYKVSDIEERSQKYWNAAVAMNFCDNFLEHITRNVVNDCDICIYKFERFPKGDISMTELPPTSEYAFLPSWYTEL